VCKKDKIWCLKKVFHETFLCLLYTWHKNLSFPRNLACTHIMPTYTPNFCLDFSDILKCFFCVVGAYTPMFKSGFPRKKGQNTKKGSKWTWTTKRIHHSSEAPRLHACPCTCNTGSGKFGRSPVFCDHLALCSTQSWTCVMFLLLTTVSLTGVFVCVCRLYVTVRSLMLTKIDASHATCLHAHLSQAHHWEMAIAGCNKEVTYTSFS
jgi:hypothetical protein